MKQKKKFETGSESMIENSIPIIINKLIIDSILDVEGERK